MTSEVTIRLKLCVPLFLVAASFAVAQSSLVPPGTAYTALPEPGTGHDYIQGLSETVDPSTGALTIRIAIPMPPSRGLALPFNIVFNSNFWLTGGTPISPIMFNDISTSAVVGTGAGNESQLGGWSNTLPWAGYTQVSQVMQSPLLENTLNPQGLVTCYYNVNWTFHDSTGAAKGLGLYTVPWGNSAGNSAPPEYPCLGQAASVYQVNGFPGSGPALGETPEALSSNDYGVEATVGTAASFLYPAQQYLSSLQVADRDGNTYSFNPYSGLASSIEDRNGNIVSIQTLSNGATTITDTTGQVVMSLSSFGNMSTGDTLTVRGEPSYYLTWETVTNGSTSFSVLKSITLPNSQTYAFTYTTFTETIPKECNPATGGGEATIPVLKRITYPTQATVTYEWTSAPDRKRQIQVLNSGFPQNIQVTSCPVPSVYTRTVSFDGVHNALQQIFSYPEPAWAATDGNYQNLNNLKWTSEQTSVITTDELGGPSYTTTYTYVPGLSGEPVQPGMYDVMSPSDSTWFSVPVESNIVTTNSSSAMVKTAAKNWYNAHYLQAELDTVAGGKSFLTTYKWNGPNEIAEKDEYDFSAQVTQTSGSPWTSTAVPLRKTVTNYQPFNATPVFGGRAIYDRPCQTIVYGSGSQIAETDNYYDGGSALCTASAGQTTASVTPSLPSGTYDSVNFGSGSTNPRGNVTKTVSWLSSGSSPTATYAYDQSGQMISETDPCGNSSCSDMSGGSSHTTTYSYTDSPSGGDSNGNSNAYLTTVKSPTVNGVTLQKTFTYNYTTGELVSSKDVNNGLTTTYCYITNGCSGSTSDPFNRLTETDYPDGGKTNVYYQDSTPSVTTTKLQTPNPATTSVAIMDSMGHVIQTQSSDPAGSDVVNITYDGAGQVFTKTNPFLSSSQPSSTFISTPSGTPATTYYYDALGHLVQQSQPDGNNKLQWCYNGVATAFTVASCSPLLGTAQTQKFGNETAGAWVDSTDEAQNHRQQATSSLGHLVEVMEPNGVSQSPTMETDYNYDALNNLWSVNQKGNGSTDTPRSRSFFYDSLSRLLCASNPENSTVACPTSNATNYTYDANGNVQSKTDSRGITTQFGYDALNRLIAKTYSSNANGTPSSCYQYGTSVGFIGRLVNEWTQSASAGVCPATAPASGYLALKSILAYDSMGRPTSAQQKQCIGSTCSAPSPYSLGMAYDLAGNMTDLTNSVGASGQPLTLNHYFDAASRPCLTTSTWSGTALLSSPLNLFQTNPSTATPGYAAFGGLQNWYMGSNSSSASTACNSTPSSTINVTQSYTNRLWLNSTSATGQIP